jgi:hypothetical protein
MVIVAVVGLILLAFGLGLFAYIFHITAGGFRTRGRKRGTRLDVRSPFH